MKMYNEEFSLLRKLANDTFHRVLHGHELRCAQGEETITDINLLELRRAKLRFLRVDKPDKAREAKSGFDWEFWIGGHRSGWWRYCAQAKRLNLDSRTYRNLRHKVRQVAKWQIDILDDFANRNNSIPLYCFYNYVEKKEGEQHWHCNLEAEVEQLGCTVVPLYIVKEAHRRWKPKTFSALHGNVKSKPWQCLLCPEIVKSGTQDSMNPFAHPEKHPTKFRQLPTYLRYLEEEGGHIRELPDDFYRSTYGSYPRRIMLIDTEV